MYLRTVCGCFRVLSFIRLQHIGQSRFTFRLNVLFRSSIPDIHRLMDDGGVYRIWERWPRSYNMYGDERTAYHYIAPDMIIINTLWFCFRYIHRDRWDRICNANVHTLQRAAAATCSNSNYSLFMVCDDYFISFRDSRISRCKYKIVLVVLSVFRQIDRAWALACVCVASRKCLNHEKLLLVNDSVRFVVIGVRVHYNRWPTFAVLSMCTYLPVCTERGRRRERDKTEARNSRALCYYFHQHCGWPLAARNTCAYRLRAIPIFHMEANERARARVSFRISKWTHLLHFVVVWRTDFGLSLNNVRGIQPCRGHACMHI